MPALYVVFVVYLVFSASALVLLKFGSSNLSFLWENSAFQFRIDPWFVSGLSLYALSFLLSLFPFLNPYWGEGITRAGRQNGVDTGLAGLRIK